MHIHRRLAFVTMVNCIVGYAFLSPVIAFLLYRVLSRTNPVQMRSSP
jgi:hypothetical protein